MILGIDHLVIACPDPAAAAAELERAAGLAVTGGGEHPTLGTVNRLVWLGDTYLELIGVVDPARAASSWIGAPTLAVLEAGGGFVTYALATDDLESEVARLRASGAQLIGPLPGERRRPDGRTVRWLLAHPDRLAPDEPPFLIEHDSTAAEWTAVEREARAEEAHPSIGGTVRLVRLEIPVPDVHRVAMRYVRTLGLTFRPSLSGRRARDMSVGGGQTIRLRPSLRPGARTGADREPAMVLRSTAGHPTDVVVLGCRFILEPRP